MGVSVIIINFERFQPVMVEGEKRAILKTKRAKDLVEFLGDVRDGRKTFTEPLIIMYCFFDLDTDGNLELMQDKDAGNVACMQCNVRFLFFQGWCSCFAKQSIY
jgi:hypothetical protein